MKWPRPYTPVSNAKNDAANFDIVPTFPFPITDIKDLQTTLRYSVLPEDDWFTDICQDAMDRFSGKPKLSMGIRSLAVQLLLYQHSQFRPSDLMGVFNAKLLPLL
ncbi:hypothetical protein U1Q18_022736 [Sarracenia purpurea var. burkii]